jgi:hypothetical protein
MKTLFVFIALCFTAVVVVASPDSSMVYIKRGALPPDVLKKFEQATTNVTTVTNIMQTVNEFKGKVDPREIGTAIDTVSTILSRQSNQFAESKVGKFTIALIVWRIFGNAFGEFILKTIFIVTAFIIFCVMWRKHFIVNKFVKTAKSTPKKWGFTTNNVTEVFEFKTPHDLFAENGENNWGGSSSMGPETLAKLMYIAFFLLCLAVVVWK